MPDYDEKEDLMDRLVALGKRKKFLSLDDLHRAIPENMMSADDIEDVLDRLEGANVSVAETDAQLIEGPRRLPSMRTRRKQKKRTSILTCRPGCSTNRMIPSAFTFVKWASCPS